MVWCAAARSPTSRASTRGNVTDHVIEGAYEVLHGFEQVQVRATPCDAITLDDWGPRSRQIRPLVLRHDEPGGPWPITESQILRPRRSTTTTRPRSTFNRVQENLVKGGLSGRSANGRQQRTRPVQGIDQSVRLSNRALWLLADGLLRQRA